MIGKLIRRVGMTKHHQSREEWEQEFRDVQRNALPEEGIRSASIIARRVAEEGSAPVRDFRHLVLIFLTGLFFAAAVALAFVAVREETWTYGVLGALSMGGALLLGYSVFTYSGKK